jgi:kynurenine formamidase
MKFPFNVIDLTHQLSSDVPSWDMGCGFQCDNTLDYADCTTDVKFRVQHLQLPAGLGTHIDAPAHCVKNGKSVEQISFDQLIAPCIVVDISSKAHENYQCSLEDVTTHEQKYGKIPKKSFVIIYTGWDKHWGNEKQYRNNLQFPSVSKETALLLLEREIVGLGIDTLSPDTEQSGYPVHHALLGADKYIIENIANTQALPTMGSFIMALPIPIVHGTEAPIRLIALVPRDV